MPAEPAELTALVGLMLTSLTSGAFRTYTKSKVKEYLDRRRVDRALETAVDATTEALSTFLETELSDPRHRELLISECQRELLPVMAEPRRLFEGSLDGQRLFDQLYPDGGFPEAIRDEGLENAWALFVPRVATLLCGAAAALRDWELEAWREGYKRLDELVAQIRRLREDVDAIARRPISKSASLFEKVLRIRRQVRGLRAELGGLGDTQGDADLDAMFVFPAFQSHEEEKKGRQRSFRRVVNIEEGPVALATFLMPGARSIIVAGPGAGKTTWMLWMERHGEAQPAGELLLRVALRTASVPPAPIHELLRVAVGAHLAAELDPETARGWLDQGRVHVLVDGLDELTPDRRDHAVAWIRELETVIGRGAMVLTSRPLATRHLDQLRDTGWQSWALLPFDEWRIVDYIQRWSRFAPFIPDADRNLDAATLASTWSQDPTLSELTSNPLLLGTLLTVHHMEGRLPAGRAALYRKYVDGMLGAWDGRRKVEPPRVKLDGVVRRRVLRDLALAMFQRGRDALEDEEALSLVQQALSAQGLNCPAQDVLSDLRERSGLLIGPGTWNFAHKSIGEFLVAEAVVEGNVRAADGQTVDRSWLLKRRHEDRFNIVLFLWAGLVPAADLESELEVLLLGEVRDVALGLGLVEDQFERLGEGMRRGAAVCVANLTNDESGRVYVFPFVSAWRSYNQAILRGISGVGRSVDPLLERLLQSGALGWNDILQKGGCVGANLWLKSQRSPWFGDVDPKPPPSIGDASELWYQLVYFQLSPVLGRASLPDAQTVHALIGLLPHAKMHLPLLLMAVACEHEVRLKSTISLTFLLDLLSTLPVADASESWLEGSRHAQLVCADTVSLEEVDLLERFFALLRRSAETAPAGVIAGCSAHLDHLRTQRAALPKLEEPEEPEEPSLRPLDTDGGDFP